MRTILDETRLHPAIRDVVANSHADIVHRRTALSHASSSWPVARAAMQNAKGIVMPTKPS